MEAPRSKSPKPTRNLARPDPIDERGCLERVRFRYQTPVRGVHEDRPPTALRQRMHELTVFAASCVDGMPGEPMRIAAPLSRGGSACAASGPPPRIRMDIGGVGICRRGCSRGGPRRRLMRNRDRLRPMRAARQAPVPEPSAGPPRAALRLRAPAFCGEGFPCDPGPRRLGRTDSFFTARSNSGTSLLLFATNSSAPSTSPLAPSPRCARKQNDARRCRCLADEGDQVHTVHSGGIL